ncbi:hypothetical protein [uncultured Erythrobacter sp.]|uniref:hypothetical protein n=1 Tax=uncultured Erythrobacter sp. TaxID=263913 RepID=UPI00265A2E7A|nr:hypothetical protein [uncultured Erythrobacter sp.]
MIALRENAGTAGLGVGPDWGFCGKLCDFGAFGGVFEVHQAQETALGKAKNINIIM